MSELPRPLGLVAELTYRCPLRCPYCSNPAPLDNGAELPTADWSRVLRQSAELGVMHALFTGGEPLLREDLPELVAVAREAGLYTNLITSGFGLTRERAEELKSAGLESVQLSFQADDPALADSIAGARAHARKLEAAALARELGWPLTVNIVLHRANISRLRSMIALAESVGAIRLELANTQFYGWAFRNREALLPTREQIEEASRVAAEETARLQGKVRVIYVIPDYYARRPKPCMNGWGQRYITVNPVGAALPCGSATVIRGLRFESVRERDLGWIWRESDAFNRFRGTDWMPDPCQSCDRRAIDFGGCRCQASLVTGDAGNVDPACELAPEREKLVRLVAGATGGHRLPAPFAPDQYRVNPPPGASRSGM